MRGGRSVTDRPTPITILAVDDSPEFLAAVRAWIESQPGLALAGTAENGQLALDANARLTPDLILMDGFMPVLDGFEATRRLKTEPGAPPVVILSVHEGETVEKEAWVAGADRFVSKAHFARDLPAVIRELIDGGPGRPAGPSRQEDRPVSPDRPDCKPEAPAERQATDTGWLSRLWKGARRRVRHVQSIRRPGVGMAGVCYAKGEQQ